MSRRELRRLIPRRASSYALTLVGSALMLCGSIIIFGPESPGRARGVPSVRCSTRTAMASVAPGVVSFGEDGPGRTGEKRFVPAFRIDRHEVTNRAFAAFVTATGYITQAEREGSSAVFTPPESISTMDPRLWWKMVKGASWRHPTGPGSDLIGREDYPVVQVTYGDAVAYAAWAGRSLPDEVQWERAARGRQDGPVEPTRWAFSEAGNPLANTWQGVFPVHQLAEDGFAGLAPVGCFPPNGFGLHDMVGNVWEWTSGKRGDGARVVKGGSFLCSRNYCSNFRPAAWQAQESDLATSHIGFRTVDRESGAKED